MDAEQLRGGFTLLDWAVVAAILVATTIVGERLAGKQNSIRDFFLGGRKLPWYAVAASIVATEISAVTYISLPAVVYKPEGDLRYLQLGLIGSFLARWLVALVLVPAYYEREIYSPYDYMGARLGERVRATTTVLFSIGGVIAQAARVYLTAVVLEMVMYAQLGTIQRATGISSLAAAVLLIGIVAVVWTWLGGIATVIWTDAILFALFLIGLAATLFVIDAEIPGGMTGAVADAWDAGKLRFFDFTTDPTKAYTVWAALIGVAWWNTGVFGTDQLMAQRMFCCRSAAEAKKAVVASYGGMSVTILVSLVGVGLWAYYNHHPLSSAGATLVAETADRIFPVFIVEVLPVGVKGLVLAGAFAAAISSLDSILAALAQTTLSAAVLPLRARRGRVASEASDVRLSRIFVFVWAIVLCGVAIVMEQIAHTQKSLLDLALSMATYTTGAVLAAFFLAFSRRSTCGNGFPWAAALSVLTVFATQWHAPWAFVVCALVCIAVLVSWIAAERTLDFRSEALALGCAAILLICAYGTFPATDDGPRQNVSFVWCVPLGSIVAFVYTKILAPRGETVTE